MQLVVFDLDGTLVDSQRDLANAANALVVELGGMPLSEDAVASMVGEGAAVLVRRVLHAAQLDPEAPGTLPRFLELYDQRLIEHTRAYEGIEEVLQALEPRMPLAVLTNKPQKPSTRILEALGLATYFRWIVGGDTPLGRKPEPAALWQICADAGVPPGETLLIGDSPIDLQTARRAGTRVALVRYGFGFRFTPEDLAGITVVEAPPDLLRLE